MYGIGYISDPTWLVLIVVSLAIGFGTQLYIKSRYKKWNRVANTVGLSGGQFARKMLDANGLSQVGIEVVSGQLTDHYDPKKNTIALSEEVYRSRSVSAMAIACHECGHAIQHAARYAPAVVRGALVLPINIAGNLWVFVLIIGLSLSFMEMIWAAVLLYTVTIAFQLVTLPVEFNASRRAREFINSYGYIPQEESIGAASVLSAAALTYVAAALISLLQLIRIISYTRR